MELFLIIILSYLSGSIPFGLIITKIFTGTDVRKIGSGNIGATNVLRSGNKYLALLTLLLDSIKGYLPVIITQNFFSDYFLLAALFSFLGHLFPLWLNFKGGKGVATYLGILFALSYPLAILFIFTWLVLALIFKYSSLSSMIGAMTVFVVTAIRESAQDLILKTQLNNDVDLKLILFILFILIIFTHKKNISNLKNKIEQKIKL